MEKGRGKGWGNVYDLAAQVSSQDSYARFGNLNALHGENKITWSHLGSSQLKRRQRERGTCRVLRGRRKDQNENALSTNEWRFFFVAGKDRE